MILGFRGVLVRPSEQATWLPLSLLTDPTCGISAVGSSGASSQLAQASVMRGRSKGYQSITLANKRYSRRRATPARARARALAPGRPRRILSVATGSESANVTNATHFVLFRNPRFEFFTKILNFIKE